MDLLNKLSQKHLASLAVQQSEPKAPNPIRAMDGPSSPAAATKPASTPAQERSLALLRRAVNTSVPLTGGNGSNNTNQLAKAVVDPRYTDVFTIDVGRLTPTAGRVFIQIDSNPTKLGVALSGKQVVFCFVIPGGSPIQTLNLKFSTTFGNSIPVLQSSSLKTTQSCVSLISNGYQFILKSASPDLDIVA